MLPEVPTSGKWALDPCATVVEFVVRHALATRVRGRFTDVQGSAVVSERPRESSIVVTVATASVDTGSPDRDAFIRSADFFDVQAYPTMTFRSSGLRKVRGARWTLRGDLTIGGVTAPIALRVEHLETSRTAPTERAKFQAAGEVDRTDWDLSWNKVLEASGIVGKRVKLGIEASFVKQSRLEHECSA